MKHLFLLLLSCLMAVTLFAQRSGKQPKVVLPSYPGGIQEYLAANIKYPESAREHNVEGRVIARFMVTRNGDVRNIKLRKSLGSSCDEEVLRVLNAMGKWTPGTRKGKPIDVYYNLPVHFELEDDTTLSDDPKK